MYWFSVCPVVPSNPAGGTRYRDAMQKYECEHRTVIRSQHADTGRGETLADAIVVARQVAAADAKQDTAVFTEATLKRRAQRRIEQGSESFNGYGVVRSLHRC